jgi:hypothetical protein
LTHLLASWLVAARTTNNPRDCRLATLAGLLPDADGLGLVADVTNDLLGGHPTHYYAQFHHYWLHGVFGAALITLGLTLFARERWRVAFVALFLFHLHLLCDFAGSRGPSPEDLWPIFYLGPFDKDPMWIWKGQWRLDGWQNRLVSAGTLVGSMFVALRAGHSFVGVFNRRADRVFVDVLRGWWSAFKQRVRPDNG